MIHGNFNIEKGDLIELLVDDKSEEILGRYIVIGKDYYEPEHQKMPVYTLYTIYSKFNPLSGIRSVGSSWKLSKEVMSDTFYTWRTHKTNK